MTCKNAKAPSAAKIEITQDGPYFVTGSIPVQEQIIVTDSDGVATEWEAGAKVPAGDSYCLCRCGHSTEKPFCSGAHIEIGFDGTETASRKPHQAQSERIEGPTLNLADAERFCAGAGFCHRSEGIWDLVPKSDDPNARRIAIEEACNCPAGRLVVRGKDNMAIEPPLDQAIGLVKDPNANEFGPLWVRGNIPIESADGTPYEVRNRTTLCRCGRSANKPFCDGSHAETPA